MPAAQPTMVYPVPGIFIPGEPAVEREVETKTEAERLVATGAFALSAAEAREASPWSDDAINEMEQPADEPEQPADEPDTSASGTGAAHDASVSVTENEPPAAVDEEEQG